MKTLNELIKEAEKEFDKEFGTREWVKERPEILKKFLATTIRRIVKQNLEAERKKQCTRTHDYGYGNGYIPHDEKGQEVKNLKCIYCGYVRQGRKRNF